MTPLLNACMPVNPLSQHEIACHEALYSLRYYAGGLSDDIRVTHRSLKLESYDVDRRCYTEISREEIQKCFDVIAQYLKRKPLVCLDLECLQNGINKTSPIPPTTLMAAGLFWRVAKRSEERITSEKIRQEPIPDGLDDFQKRQWQIAADAGRFPILGSVIRDWGTSFKRSVVEEVYEEMEVKFKAREDWVSNPLYDRKIIDKKERLEKARNETVKGRIILTVFLATLGVFFFDSSQDTSDSQSQEGFSSN